jgi:1-acyl-sn-glycerol-3-phosphate acyltransferase
VVRRASRRNPRSGAAFVFIEVLLRPLLAILLKRDWRGRQNVPREGAVIVVANHYTFFDPLSIGHFLVRAGRTPRFLAKAGVFKNKYLGRLFRSAGQIPVYRDSRDAMLAIRDAIKAIERGEVIIVYPEGTMTKDPNLWPMVGKTGAARIALRTGAPVLPIAQWGAQDVLAPYSKKFNFFPRKTLRVTAGEPIDLRAKFGKEINADSLQKSTEYLMDVITGMLAEIRDEQPPAVRFDPDVAKALPTDAPTNAVPTNGGSDVIAEPETDSATAESTAVESTAVESTTVEPGAQA